ncbi:MAG: phospho-sugar mutase [Alphaproteobacteria bacterium]|nr:phospho-sugar mutase [Alphaproteobacteria bacterium]
MSDVLSRAREGFAPLAVDQRFKDAALTRLERWLSDPATADYVPTIEAMAEDGRWELLLDCFYQVIPFGTGGRRGAVGVGPNRINPYTIASSIQGHCQYLRQDRPDEALAVVIAYDVRRYLDARGHYPYAVPNPVMGLSSRDFAELAAGVYAANGVHVHILPRGSERYISTPELSFSIRALGAQGGLNVSASHNPPDDNGAKIYNVKGGQEVPPHDERLVEIVEQVREVRRVSWEQAVEQGFIHFLDDAVHQAYIDTNLACSRSPEARGTHVVFTALHGTGDTTVVEVLRAAGFQVTLEPTQASHDGRFPNVPFGIPNPEVRQSMDRAVALARSVGADLVMACDPDADRLGVVVRHGEGFRFLNGNEMGALVARYVLSYGAPGGHAKPIVMKTEVSSSLISRLALHHGAQVVDNLLVGFKYIADALSALESGEGFQQLVGTEEDFVVGVEESHGVLVTPHIRDKDAAGAALMLAEFAHHAAAQGRTLVDELAACWLDVGYVSNRLISTVMRGATGRTRIEALQRSFREDPPSHIGGRAVTAFHDRQDVNGPFGPIRSGTDESSRDVLVFELGERARLILRPSGTEPKNKVYAELAGTPGAPLETEVPRVDAECRRLAEDFVLLMLERCELPLPRWALAVSDLVAVEQKRHFAELMPRLHAALKAGAPLPDLEAELKAYGKDGAGLAAPGVRAWIAATQPEAAHADAIRDAFGIR